MKIGIDIDGVLLDIENYIMTRGSKFFWDNYKKTIENPFTYNIYEMFGMDQEAERKFWEKCYYNYIMEAPRMYASEVISKLSEAGHKIYIITARSANALNNGVSEEEAQKLVPVWLEKNNIVYDKLLFVAGDKTEACVANKIDVMIEDSPSQIKSISKAIPVIVFDARYNQKISGENIVRNYSWYDVLKTISDLKKKNKKQTEK